MGSGNGAAWTVPGDGISPTESADENQGQSPGLSTGTPAEKNSVRPVSCLFTLEPSNTLVKED